MSGTVSLSACAPQTVPDPLSPVGACAGSKAAPVRTKTEAKAAGATELAKKETAMPRSRPE